MDAEFRVLGPLEAVVDGQPIALPAEKPRALLALLLLARGRVVSVDGLVAGLWGDEAPETATKALQVYVSQLRKAIGADRVTTRTPGYSLRVDEGELDLDRFERLVRAGRDELAAGNAADASRLLAEALELWRGPPLAEFAAEPFAGVEGARLEDAQLAAVEERVDADLALGRHARLVPELEELVARHPLRERPRGQLMLALYRSGRQADALEVYRRTRATLMDELGIEPSPALRELEQAILTQDAALRVTPAPTAAAPPGAAEATRASRRGPLITVALIAAAVAVVLVSLALTRGGGSGGDGEQRAYVTKMENLLAQSRDGRRSVVATLAAEARCGTSPHAAAAALDRVQRNRQSLLEQVVALTVPRSGDAQRSADLFQQSVYASITADWHYRDWLLDLKRCAPPDRSRNIRLALAADARASRAKKAFVAAFNPLAQRFGQKAWSDWEF